MDLPNTTDNKRIFTKPDGTQVIDLTEQHFYPTGDQKIYDVVVVSRDFAMRPDLVAQLAYGDINSTDILLKSNGVSNPFSIDEYDMFFLQDKRSLSNQFSNASDTNKKEIVRNQYIDPSKAPEQDDNLKLFSNRNKPKKGVKKDTPALPPNFANFGDMEIKLRDGMVIYGEDVSDNKPEEKPLVKKRTIPKIAKEKPQQNSKMSLE